MHNTHLISPFTCTIPTLLFPSSSPHLSQCNHLWVCVTPATWLPHTFTLFSLFIPRYFCHLLSISLVSVSLSYTLTVSSSCSVLIFLNPQDTPFALTYITVSYKCYHATLFLILPFTHLFSLSPFASKIFDLFFFVFVFLQIFCLRIKSPLHVLPTFIAFCLPLLLFELMAHLAATADVALRGFTAVNVCLLPCSVHGNGVTGALTG